MAETRASSPAQEFIPITDIQDGVLVRRDDTIVGVMAVSATNLALKSPDEQQATMVAFQNFLNTLEFSVQIVIQSRAFDVRPYVKTLEDRLEVIPEELLRIQTAMYIEYIKTIAENQNIMQKNFYIVIPFSGEGVQREGKKSGFFASMFGGGGKSGESETPMESKVAQLEQRMNVVSSGLSSLGLGVTPVGTEGLVELLYELYNPGDSVGGVGQLAADAGVK
jgi:hypothetical protein